MVQYSIFDRVMKTEVHLKKRANPKSRTSRNFIRGVSFVVILFMVTTCSKKENELEKFMREPPPIVTVTQVENGLKISWNEVHGANNYQIERSVDNFSGNTLLWSVPVYETFYIDENPLEGINYYRVCAQKCNRYDLSTDKECYSLYSNVVSFNYTTASKGIEAGL